MNLLKLFTGSFDKIIDSVGNAADKIFTSDEERLKFKNELVKIQAASESEARQLEAQFEKEITTRHANDMKSDSWLSKNVRPIVLLITMATIYLLVYLSVFGTLTVLQIGVLKVWIAPLVSLFGTMVVFYFGSRGVEKFKAIANRKKDE